MIHDNLVIGRGPTSKKGTASNPVGPLASAFLELQSASITHSCEDFAWEDKGILTQRRKGAEAQRVFSVLASLQCYIGKLRISGKIFPPLFSLFAHVQILWLRRQPRQVLATLR
jgi:hypothetical protein